MRLVRLVRQITRGLRSLFQKDRLEQELDDELRFHLEMETEKYLRAGMNAEEARRRALLAFGGVTQHKEAARDVRRWRAIEDFVQDLRHAFRMLGKHPGFAAACVLTLAVGIGATTAIFSAADHVLLRPLPYTDADRVVTLWETDRSTGEDRREVSAGNFLDWQERSRSFTAMGLAEPYSFDLTGEHPPESVEAWIVSEGFLEALGVRPVLGQMFRPEDFQPNAAPVVLLPHGLWQRRFGSDPSIVGRTIELNEAPATVLGVLPPWLEYPEPEATTLWAPKRFRPEEREDRSSGYMHAVARLRPGVSVAEARAELEQIGAALAREYPETNRNTGINAVALDEQILGDIRPALIVLLGAVAFLMLIACTNVASLLLARGTEREHDLGVRTALGARRGRLIGHLAAESLLLGILGGVAGLLIAYLGVAAFTALSPPELPLADRIALDGRVLGFAAALTIVTTLVFGLLPALHLSRSSPLTALKVGRATTASRARNRMRSGLVVVEIALALVLQVGAGLLARSFVRLLDNDLGFVTEHRVALQLFIWDRAPTPEQRRQRAAAIAERLEALSGVDGVGIATALPFHPHRIASEEELIIEGRPTPPPGERPKILGTIATAEYFQVMGIPLLRGRSFTPRDRPDSPPVALINESAARRFFPDEDPVGQQVTVGVMGPPTTREIVGVIGDLRATTLDSDPRPELYVPHSQASSGSLTFVVRTRTDPAGLIPLLREQIWQVDPAQTIYHAATLEGLVADTLAERRFHLLLLGAFSLVALLLAAIGIYGVISFATHRRFHEIGIRVALGARSGDVLRMIVGQGLRIGLPGILLGIVGALVLTRYMEHMLYEVEPTDPTTLGAVAVFLALLSAAASYVPARRAVRVDPVEALRAE